MMNPFKVACAAAAASLPFTVPIMAKQSLAQLIVVRLEALVGQGLAISIDIGLSTARAA
ncbi:hypothetical protein IG631_23646 [Alternaria alternata]|nr:hypothetical protein IG631_23646 [Alternaria alternata]